ncbi:MAG TPA: helix-turn-helix transcriptional regulator [Rubrobacteraceae bacterium]|nr:helix-turn-helix transcriptional regulator [Rubrobacteraceae bacterium]
MILIFCRLSSSIPYSAAMTSKDRECRAFGTTVRLYRKQAGYSQEELADRAGIHRTYIGGIERGERNPTLTMIHRLARALGVPSHLLLEEPPKSNV